MKNLILVFVLILISCTHQTVFRGAHGETSAHIDCLNSLNKCFSEANSICPIGFDVVDQKETQLGNPVDPNPWAFTKTWIRYDLTVNCRSENSTEIKKEIAPQSEKNQQSLPTIENPKSPFLGDSLSSAISVCQSQFGNFSRFSKIQNGWQCSIDDWAIFVVVENDRKIIFVQTFFLNGNFQEALSLFVSKIGNFDQMRNGGSGCRNFDWLTTNPNTNGKFFSLSDCNGFFSATLSEVE